MELRNLQEFLDYKMDPEKRQKEKTRFKFTTCDNSQLMLYIKNKYKSTMDKKPYIQELAVKIYDSNGNPITTSSFSGDHIVQLDDLRGDIKNLQIPTSILGSSIYFTKGDLYYTKSLYLSKISVDPALRGNHVASSLITDYEKYAQVNGFDRLYGHGCAFGATFPHHRTPEDEAFLNETIKRCRLKGLSEDDKNLILFYAKLGFVVDNRISKMHDGCEYSFAFSKDAPSYPIPPNETLFLKESKNKLDKNTILLS